MSEHLTSHFSINATLIRYDKTVNMAAGAGVKQMFTVPAINGTTDILLSTVTDSDGTIISQHPIPFTEPKNMKLPKAEVTFKVIISLSLSLSCAHTFTRCRSRLLCLLLTSAFFVLL